MDEIKKIYQKEKLEKTVKNLEKRNFEVIQVENTEEARKKVLEFIPEGSSISMGGSVTLNMMELLSEFRSDRYRFFERFSQSDWPSTVKVMRESLHSDFLVTGTNAVTEDGEFMQIDSGGNRVAGMVYGPKNVIIVTSIKKIVKNLEEAYERMYYAGPLNSKRLNHKTPCNFSGKCEDCKTGMRMCNFVSVVRNGKRAFGNTKIILINEDVGY